MFTRGYNFRETQPPKKWPLRPWNLGSAAFTQFLPGQIPSRIQYKGTPQWCLLVYNPINYRYHPHKPYLIDYKSSFSPSSVAESHGSCFPAWWRSHGLLAKTFTHVWSVCRYVYIIYIHMANNWCITIFPNLYHHSMPFKSSVISDKAWTSWILNVGKSQIKHQ